GLFYSNQVVTAVISRTEHDALRFALQCIHCLAERLRCHSRTIRINQTTRLKTDAQQVFGRKKQPLAESVTALWQQFKIARQNVIVFVARVSGSVDGDASRLSSCARDRAGGIP